MARKTENSRTINGVTLQENLDFKKSSRAPFLLTAYGAYGIQIGANFESSRISLLDRGFTIAIAHIRGGNKMGEAWHREGMLLKKKNTFNDFIDCSQFLINRKWTSPHSLIVEGTKRAGFLKGPSHCPR